MKALLKTFGVVFMVAALSACGKTDSEKAQDKVNDTNTKIARVQQINADLSNKGMNLQTYETPSRLPENLSKDEADQAKALLSEYVALSNEILDAPNTRGVVLHGESALRTMKGNAQAYLELLKTYKPFTNSTSVPATRQKLFWALDAESRAVYAIQIEAHDRTKVDLARDPKKLTASDTITNVKLFKILSTDELKKLESEAGQMIVIANEEISNGQKLLAIAPEKSSYVEALDELNKLIRDNAKANQDEIRTELAIRAITKTASGN